VTIRLVADAVLLNHTLAADAARATQLPRDRAGGCSTVPADPSA
jgi:hypothetical protein